MHRIYSTQRSYTRSPSDAEGWLILVEGLTACFKSQPDCFFTVNSTRAPILLRSQSREAFTNAIESSEEPVTHIRIEIADRPTPDTSPMESTFVRLDAYRQTRIGVSSNLQMYCRGLAKSAIYEFEQSYLEHKGATRKRPEVTFGRPCEVMACMVDLHGFGAFCERPEIESPYTCAVVSAFYQSAEHGFESFPPDVLKIQGDGILMIWKTGADDRNLVAKIIREGVVRLDQRWKSLIKDPQFYHGAPSELGTGVSFGLASSLPDQTDFLGRPINMAARISDQCSGEEILLDDSIPGASVIPNVLQKTIQIKGVGKRSVWSVPLQLSTQAARAKSPPKTSRLFLPELLTRKSKMAPR